MAEKKSFKTVSKLFNCFVSVSFQRVDSLIDNLSVALEDT